MRAAALARARAGLAAGWLGTSPRLDLTLHIDCAHRRGASGDGDGGTGAKDTETGLPQSQLLSNFDISRLLLHGRKLVENPSRHPTL